MFILTEYGESDDDDDDNDCARALIVRRLDASSSLKFFSEVCCFSSVLVTRRMHSMLTTGANRPPNNSFSVGSRVERNAHMTGGVIYPPALTIGLGFRCNPVRLEHGCSRRLLYEFEPRTRDDIATERNGTPLLAFHAWLLDRTPLLTIINPLRSKTTSTHLLHDRLPPPGPHTMLWAHTGGAQSWICLHKNASARTHCNFRLNFTSVIETNAVFRVRLLLVHLFRVRLRLFRIGLFRICLFRISLFRICLFRISLFRISPISYWPIPCSPIPYSPIPCSPIPFCLFHAWLFHVRLTRLHCIWPIPYSPIPYSPIPCSPIPSFPCLPIP